uniref:Uncharacterized protein n=2 Tax=Helianthus annuus TaxID=4232 RepID=A0A251UE87_HELAN
MQHCNQVKKMTAGQGMLFQKPKWSISGLYVYDDKRKASPDTEIKKYIDKASWGNYQIKT